MSYTSYKILPRERQRLGHLSADMPYARPTEIEPHAVGSWLRGNWE